MTMGRPPLPPDQVRRATSVRLPAQLVDRATAYAREHGGTFTDAVESALQLMLDSTAPRAEAIRAEVVAELRQRIEEVLGG